MMDNEKTGGLGETLSGGRTMVADIKMLARAARERWDVPESARKEAGDILLRIAREDTTTILDDEGKAHEVSNARNQIAAIKTLAVLDAANQSDDHLADKNLRLDQGKPTDRMDVSGLGDAVQRYREAGVPEDRWPPVVRDYARGVTSAKPSGN